jgi:hypothetical protein
MSAGQPLRMEVTFQPQGAHTVIQALGDREVYHGAIMPYSARWLHISLSFILQINLVQTPLSAQQPPYDYPE